MLIQQRLLPLALLSELYFPCLNSSVGCECDRLSHCIELSSALSYASICDRYNGLCQILLCSL
ncbi:MAG: hypothetical protein KME55_12380 [Nostoc indistinguendum CM1-VF10]|nr:hypothetical protein [Nostoc indistinguendum CM1-VF10]